MTVRMDILKCIWLMLMDYIVQRIAIAYYSFNTSIFLLSSFFFFFSFWLMCPFWEFLKNFFPPWENSCKFLSSVWGTFLWGSDRRLCWPLTLMKMSNSVDNIFGFDVHYVIIFAAQLTSWLNFTDHTLGGKLGDQIVSLDDRWCEFWTGFPLK